MNKNKKQVIELRKKSVEDLHKEVVTLREKLSKLDFAKISGEVTNVRERFYTRHDLSRVLGIIREREIAETK